MLRMRLLFQRVMGKIRRRRFKPLETLDTEVLKQAVEEARLLRTRYAVEVSVLAPGEKPDLPRKADTVSGHSIFQP